jgi:hypothetical protein
MRSHSCSCQLGGSAAKKRGVNLGPSRTGWAPATRGRAQGACGPELACGSPLLPCRPVAHRAGFGACILSAPSMIYLR